MVVFNGSAIWQPEIMNKALEHAIDAVTRLPEDEQETIACLVPEEITGERRWRKRFVNSENTLADLARRARAACEW